MNGMLSLSMCDLATTILRDDSWDLTLTHAPNSKLVPKKKVLSDDVPFCVGRQVIVNMPMDPRGTTDVYIDGTIGLCVDVGNSDNYSRLENAILLAIASAARPVHEAEPIPREEMESLAKLLAEADFEESKMILGLYFNFMRMAAAPPVNKHTAWSAGIMIVKMIQKGETCCSDLDTCIERLGNVGMIVCSIYHLLSRLREFQRRAKNRRTTKID